MIRVAIFAVMLFANFEASAGTYCYQQWCPNPTEIGDVLLTINTESGHGSISFNDVNFCSASAEFAKLYGLSLVELRNLLKQPDTRVLCESQRGQMVITKIISPK